MRRLYRIGRPARGSWAACVSPPPPSWRCRAGEPLTADLVAELVRGELAARGIAGELAVEVREPSATVPNRAGTRCGSP